MASTTATVTYRNIPHNSRIMNRTQGSANAFIGLVAWFSKNVHSTTIYTWTLHKGTLASLSGIESGDYPVDVIFCMPGDAMLKRLPDLGIPVLDIAWIRASLQAGRLLEIPPFRLDTSLTLSRGFQPTRRRAPAVSTATRAEASRKALHILRTSTPVTGLPSPESLDMQEKILSPAVEAIKSAQALSPLRPAGIKQFKPSKIAKSHASKSICHATCDELLCRHRPELAIERKQSFEKLDETSFRELTGFSPGPHQSNCQRKDSLPVIKDVLDAVYGGLPMASEPPEERSDSDKTDRYAKIRSDIQRNTTTAAAARTNEALIKAEEEASGQVAHLPTPADEPSRSDAFKAPTVPKRLRDNMPEIGKDSFQPYKNNLQRKLMQEYTARETGHRQHIQVPAFRNVHVARNRLQKRESEELLFTPLMTKRKAVMPAGHPLSPTRQVYKRPKYETPGV